MIVYNTADHYTYSYTTHISNTAGPSANRAAPDAGQQPSAPSAPGSPSPVHEPVALRTTAPPLHCGSPNPASTSPPEPELPSPGAIVLDSSAPPGVSSSLPHLLIPSRTIPEHTAVQSLPSESPVPDDSASDGTAHQSLNPNTPTEDPGDLALAGDLAFSSPSDDPAATSNNIVEDFTSQQQQHPARVYDRRPLAHEAIRSSGYLWFWKPIMLLCAFMHLEHLVSHRAVNTLISVLYYLFTVLGLIDKTSEIPRTLRTTMKHLDLGDNFVVCPLCPSCYRIFLVDSTPDTTCSHCENSPLFKNVPLETGGDAAATVGSHIVDHWDEWRARLAAKKAPKPILRAPMRLPSQLLADLINSTPTMEASLDRWHSVPPEPGRLRRVQDGTIWKTLKGPDGTPFFDDSHSAELRIGVTMGFDGCVPRLIC